MKSISTYINEKLKISSVKQTHAYKPNNSNELNDIISDLIAKRGLDADLNDIDTIKITDMHDLFYDHEQAIGDIDISEWNVSNVTDISFMFQDCEKFNSDLSNWDVRNVQDMRGMFCNCTNFNSDLFKWNVSKVKDMSFMFKGCKKFNSDISGWDVSNVTNMTRMFYDCYSFNQDLSKWDISKVVKMNDMFYNCRALKHKPSWYNDK